MGEWITEHDTLFIDQMEGWITEHDTLFIDQIDG